MTPVERQIMRRLLAVPGFLVALAACSIWTLDPYYVGFLRAPWEPSWWEVLPDTASAAARVWSFWGLATIVTGCLLMRHAGLGLFDAMLLGALAPFVWAWALGTFAGASGLMSAATLWGLLLAATVLVGLQPPKWPERPRWSRGKTLVVIAATLVIPPVFLQQLGSPASPHFDQFAPVAAAQRIATFGYWPFDNDAYGYFGRPSGMPALELFYAMLTAASGVPLAARTETAAAVPMCVLLLLVTYRLGRALAGDLCGGFASLLLLGAMIFRVLPFGHGRYVSFIPALAGLAYVLDQRPPGDEQHSLRSAWVPRLAGGLLLGTSVGFHAIIGSFAMTSAIVGAPAFVPGAAVFALPTVAIAVGPPVPSLALSAAHALGVLLLVATALWIPPHVKTPEWLSSFVGRGALLLLGGLLASAPSKTVLASFAECWTFPVVIPVAIAGTVILASTRAPARRVLLATLPAVGIAAAFVGERTSIPGMLWAAKDFGWKAHFWVPVTLCFVGGAGLAMAARRLSLQAVTAALMAVLITPWAAPLAVALGRPACARAPVRDPNYDAIPWAAAVAEYLNTAKRGFWQPRSAYTPAQGHLYDILRREIEGGRITPATHIPLLSPPDYLYTDMIRFSVFNGINADLYIDGWQWDAATVDGRMRPLQDIVPALAAHPPYVVIHDRRRDGRSINGAFIESLPLSDYEVLMNEDGVRLLRRRAQ